MSAGVPASTCSSSAAGAFRACRRSLGRARGRPRRASRRGRARCRRTTCSSKAQGGIQAAVGDDDSAERHAEDVWRSSHEDGNRTAQLVEVLTGDAPSAIKWLEELGVEFTRENGGYRLARCGGATARRLLQVGDRTGHAITKTLRRAFEPLGTAHQPSTGAPLLPQPRSATRELAGGHAAASTSSRPRRSCWPPGGRSLRRRRRSAGEFSTNHPNATGEVDEDRGRARRRRRAILDALQYHPNGGRPGRRPCRATRSPRPRAPTARSC